MGLLAPGSNPGVRILGPLAMAAVLGFAESAGAQNAANGDVPMYYGENGAMDAFQRNCAECHRSDAPTIGGLRAPFSVLSYEEAKQWAPLIAHRVTEGSMPPWGPDIQHKGQFKNERYLSSEDKATILAWAKGGAPMGDPSVQPASLDLELRGEPVTAPDGSTWWMGVPDLTARFAEPVVVCEEVTDWQPGIRMVVEGKLDEPKWVKATEMQVGSNMMHHGGGTHLGTAVPGRAFQSYPDGWAFVLPEDPAIEANMHYAKPSGPGTAREDFTRGGFIFAKPGEVIKHVVTNTIPSNTSFILPAGHSNIEVRNREYIDEDIFILAIAPHSHYRGKSVKIELQRPGSEERETLLYVPKYDFSWQMHYEFNEPKFVPAGSIYHVTWWFDNSEGNRYNPDPTEHTIYGPRSADEMMNARYYYTSAEPLNVVVGKDPIPEKYLNKARTMNERARKDMAGWDLPNLSEPCGPASRADDA